MYIYVTDLTTLMTSPCLHISLAGTIPSTFSKLTSLSLLYLFSNYLTMGSATTVPNTTFSSTTLSGGGLSLGSNCLAFHYGSISVSATHCAPTSGKSVILFEYVCALPMTTDPLSSTIYSNPFSPYRIVSTKFEQAELSIIEQITNWLVCLFFICSRTTWQWDQRQQCPIPLSHQRLYREVAFPWVVIAWPSIMDLYQKMD